MPMGPCLWCGPIVSTSPDGVFRERTELVRAVGGTGGITTVPLIEVVVRRDDGRTVALMESPDDGLVAGQRVLLVDGALLREFGSAGR